MAGRRRDITALQIGLGLAAGAAGAFLGITDPLRELWLWLVTPREFVAPHPAMMFGAYLTQTFVLAVFTFAAHNKGKPGLTAFFWVLAVWESISPAFRDDIYLIKRIYPVLYEFTGFAHVMMSAIIFFVLGARASRAAEEAPGT